MYLVLEFNYPVVHIDLEKIKHNIGLISKKCRNSGMEPVAVLKGTNGSSEVARVFVDAGISTIADARIGNLKAYEHIAAKKMLVRLPMLSEAADVVRYSDVSLNSEITVIQAIANEARRMNKQHEVILMIEAGDLREGIYDQEELFSIIKKITNLEGVNLTGLGTNLNCFGSIKPTNENLGRLVELKQEINNKLGIDIDLISGGSTGSLALIDNGEMPEGINQLRIGTAFFNGFVEVSLPRLPDTYMDTFILKAEIIEIKEKPSKPFGTTGVDSFRNKTEFPDKGIRKRAICAIGKQDTEPRFMYPVNEKVELIGSSSDHLVLDITACGENFAVGDTVSFILDYVAIMRVMTSGHVRKLYI
ncbi:alanine/ornithine racemase family PLP-dependent enzyme [Virgibacillus sp. YIM 98842]|uniref:alanine/ornithine racemase family PLP-dependent enzyme n=1 Tax=Virgibacillus sp. YIM 98842 TaxID=2663533 RepID=UPI001F09670B|nr:alanine/ornithine racemase family PLP-dependent enzyme [Virgibacillus sp. YIM 98842]